MLMLRNTHPKILILIKSLGLGGAERLLVDALPYSTIDIVTQ